MTSFASLRAKRFTIILTVFAVVIAACALPADAKAKAKPHAKHSTAKHASAPRENNRYASIVIDASTGTVLSQAHPDKQLHPASLTKIMTLLLTFEALEAHKISLNTRMPVSAHAASMAPSKLDLEPGSSIKVQDAIYAIVTKSANDVAVVLAEKLGGSESNFARMMTLRAHQLGMDNTTFINASGLHDPRQVTTARDMALLASVVINDHPGYYRYFSTANFTYNGVSMHNHNRMMETYKGMDGMKTGYIGASGFNLVASAVQHGHRLIGVVFGGKTTSSRNAEMASLLDRGFEKAGKLPDVRIASANITPQQLDPRIVQPSPQYSAPARIVQPAAQQKPAKNLLAKDMAPVPPRKPAILVALNSLNTVSPSGGTSSKSRDIKLASLAPVVDPDKYGELTGEGDIDPAETRRIETGLVAVSALRGEDYRTTQQARMLTAPTADDTWSVQIGAYSSRAVTDQAIHQSLKRLPIALADAEPSIAPLKVKDGWVFRARLAGYTREDAFRACKYLKDCMPVAPQNN